MKTEFECKFLSVNKQKVRADLKEIGFACVYGEQLSRRLTYDIEKTPEYSTWLRLRAEGNNVTLTFKHKNRVKKDINTLKEVETKVDDFEAMRTILVQAGHRENPLEENKREKWVRDDVEVCIDTWPGLNPFIEIESSSEEKVKRVAAELGFDWNNAEFGAADTVYAKELNLSLEEFQSCCIFANPPKRKN